MFSWIFWKDTIERSVSTGAQFVIGTYFVGDVWTGEIPFSFMAGLVAFGTGTGLTLLKCLAAGYVGDRQSASLDPTVAREMEV